MKITHAHAMVVQLTQDALEAARNGQWDQVIALYNHGLSQKSFKDVSPESIQSIVEWNQWLIARVQEARAAIQQNLIDIQDQRRQLEVLKRQWGANSPSQARHLLTV